MKEDILEQLVDEYFQLKGYFTTGNVKFKPRIDHPDFVSNQDRVSSDIDVLAINPQLNGPERVVIINCKSWQGGLSPQYEISNFENNKIIKNREAWKGFRELMNEKWAEAFHDKIYEITGSHEFCHVTAVTRLKGNKSTWEEYPFFEKTMRGNPVKILTLHEILDALYPGLSNTVASSSIGRLLQIIKASQWTLSESE